MPEWIFFLATVVVTALIVFVLVLYLAFYPWWRSSAGRIAVTALTAALLVTAGGICERLGHIEPHDWLVTLGYVTASAALLLAIRHVLAMRARSSETVNRGT